MIRCSKCGTLNAEDTAFCSECNAYLEWSGEKVDQEPGPPSRPPPAPGGAVPPPVSVPATAPPPPPGGSAAETPKPQPKSRKPSKGDAAPKPRPKPAAAPPKAEAPKPGERICPECGTGNDPDRKFCRRCGHSLAAAAIAVEPVPSAKVPWYRRFRRRRAGPQAYDAGQRPSRMGMRRWRPGCTSVVVVIVLLLGLGGVLSYLYVPSVANVADDIIRTVRNRIEGVSTVNPIATGGRSVGGHPAGHATDGDPETYWLGVPGEQDRWRLTMRFERPIDLRQVDIQPGASGDQYREHGRPRTIWFRAGQRSSREYVLSDDGEKQSVTVDLRGIQEVWLVVKDTYGGTEAADDVAVREVVFGAAQ